MSWCIRTLFYSLSVTLAIQWHRRCVPLCVCVCRRSESLSWWRSSSTHRGSPEAAGKTTTQPRPVRPNQEWSPSPYNSTDPADGSSMQAFIPSRLGNSLWFTWRHLQLRGKKESITQKKPPWQNALVALTACAVAGGSWWGGRSQGGQIWLKRRGGERCHTS